MMKLKLVKGKTSYEADSASNWTAPSGGVNHRTKVLKELVDPWVVKLDIVVAADSYFASVKY